MEKLSCLKKNLLQQKKNLTIILFNGIRAHKEKCLLIRMFNLAKRQKKLPKKSFHTQVRIHQEKNATKIFLSIDADNNSLNRRPNMYRNKYILWGLWIMLFLSQKIN